MSAFGDRPFRLTAEAVTGLAITSTHYKPHAQALARELAELARSLGKEVYLDLEGDADLAALEGRVELVIAVGGDGTMLGTARRLVGAHLPVVGVNLGKLGFLADHAAVDVRAWLRGEAVDGWQLTSRMMLQVTLEGRAGGTRYALNDVIVSQGVMTRLTSIAMHVGGLYATQYRADGLVVSTPTGSTAYSLSLGGPILGQGVRAVVVTPIAPHSLTNRPVVLSGDAEVAFEVITGSSEMALVVDGQERLDLVQGDRFRVVRAPTDLLLVTSGKRDYFEVLRAKLGWGANPGLGDD